MVVMRFAALLVCVGVGHARADVAAAQTLYDQAKQLEADGKYADACPLFEASYKADAQIGVLLNLADCHDKIGRTASAWVEFRDAADMAAKRGDNRESYARDRAAAIAPRLDKLRISAPASVVPGLSVTRDGADVTALIGTDVPVDPGSHVVEASAPGYKSWKQTVAVQGDGSTVDVPIGTLDKLAEPAPVAGTPAHVDAPLPRWGGVRVFVGTSFDGLEGQPGGSNMCPGMFCGSGPHNLPGFSLAVHARVNLDPSWSFDPGAGLHLRRIYTEHCSPCMQTSDVHLDDLELFGTFRYGLGPHASLLVGPYVAARVGASQPLGFDQSAVTNAGSFDLGLAAAFELFIGRWGGRLELQYGTQQVSPALSSAILGLGASLGVRI